MSIIDNVLANTIKEISRCSIYLNDGKSYVPGGQNGPYFDIETPARNTSHAAVLATAMFKQTQEEKYLAQAYGYLNYLKDQRQLTKDGVYIHRQKAGKDWCNGVIGQAWVMEAFVNAGIVFSDSNLIEYAIQLAKPFRFSFSAKAWAALDPKTGRHKVDYTLNHQLWYAAALAELPGKSYDREITAFLDGLSNGAFQVRQDGLIVHQLVALTAKSTALSARYWVYLKRNRKAVIGKEKGYHLFNLVPLARIYRVYPEHPFFNSQSFSRALAYAFAPGFYKSLEDNKYAYPYNSPAFEYPLIVQVFKDRIDLPEENFLDILLEIQLSKTYDKGVAGLFQKGTPDPITLSCRVYELALAYL